MDLGNINAESTDIAKVILAEFALVYSNNWFIIPYRVPVGSLSEIKGIVVTDVFGQKTLVEPAGQGDTNDWMSWTMFNLTKNEQTTKPLPRDNRLFIPPTISKVLESDPVESVSFVRDEMTNMVWAVETSIPDHLGKGKEGYAAAISLANYFKDLDKSNLTPVPAGDATKSSTLLKYKLGNTVPENWIPFIPVHIGIENRAIRLQRASMPRLFNGTFTPIRPRTAIARYGMKDDPTAEVETFVNGTWDEQNAPYFINEEEVPRAGAKVTASFQRTRWYNGKIFNWFGRRKTVGRGEGASGLQYDIITTETSEKEPLEKD
jgi:hypothetical protein